jgi:hypothetical protein
LILTLISSKVTQNAAVACEGAPVIRSSRLFVSASFAACMILAACGSGGNSKQDPTPGDRSPTAAVTSTGAAGTSTPVARTATPQATTQALETAAPQRPVGANGASGGTPPPPPPPPPLAGRVWTAGEAQALLTSAPLSPADLTGSWTISSDVAQDNATAAAADPRAGASFERCGRLSGRLLVNMATPDTIVGRYLGGQSVSFFTQMAVYATDAGAADCAIESAVRFSEPGELAKAFGSVFVSTTPVVTNQVAYPQMADGSIAWTLSGKTNANGLEVDLTILIVAFRKGNVTSVVGSAAASTPSTEELTPLVNLVLSRVSAAQ